MKVILPLKCSDDRRARDIPSWPSWAECQMWRPEEESDDPNVMCYYTKMGGDLIELSTVINPGYPSEDEPDKHYYLTILPERPEGDRTCFWKTARAETAEEDLFNRLAEIRSREAYQLYLNRE